MENSTDIMNLLTNYVSQFLFNFFFLNKSAKNEKSSAVKGHNMETPSLTGPPHLIQPVDSVPTVGYPMEEGGGGGRVLIVPGLPHKLGHTDQARHFPPPTLVAPSLYHIYIYI